LQLAGETGCVRGTGQLALATGANAYAFEFISPIYPATLGASVQGVYSVRQMALVSGNGQVYMGSRPYPWAWLYWLNNASPVLGTPNEWSQFGIGQEGSLFVNPAPSGNFVVMCDATWVPIELGSDTDPEAIPYAYTDAVPYMAAYYAFMSAQRQSDADKMYSRFLEFKARAQKIAVPNVLMGQYDQMQAPPVGPQGGG